MPKYPKEKIWKIYKELPEELKDAIFAVETAESIDSVCNKNEIQNPKEISGIARLTGHVLLGLLPPDEFQNSLEEELNLEKGVAKKISFAIHRFVFFPVRASLTALYQTEVAIPGIPEQEKIEKRKSSKKDTYREPVE